FPATDHGLLDGCEGVDDLPTFKLSKNFYDACTGLQQPLEDMFYNLKPTPSCIISDKTYHGRQLVTHNLCAFKIHEKLSDFDTFVLPDLPVNISIMKSQLPGLFNPRKSVKGKESKSVRKVWCIGPLSNSNESDLDRAQRGSKDSINNDGYRNWLDLQDNHSVIYACVGSITRLKPLQFIELVFGLEDSQYPFILVLKGGSRIEEIEKWLDEGGFESRVKGRGVLISEWASQVLILSHGGGMTHCGWNSTVEGVSAGVSMITWPQFVEQFFNERLVAQVLGIDVGVRSQRVMHLKDEDDGVMQVQREDVCTAVKIVMGGGKERRRKKRKG
ncbi:hypothetical protein M8C21_028732, partial [Ambrosia artemisiifolia]